MSTPKEGDLVCKKKEQHKKRKTIRMMMIMMRKRRKMCASPVAAVDIEQNDDEAQAVTGQVRAAEEPGDCPRAMFPSRHLPNDRQRDSRGHDP